MDIGTAGVVGTFITTIGGIAGLSIQQRRVHREIKNPNGHSTGEAIEEIRATVSRLEEEQVRVREDVECLKSQRTLLGWGLGRACGRSLLHNLRKNP